MAADHKKLTINMSTEVYEDLQRRAKARGITVTEPIRRAVALDKLVEENKDGELLLKQGDEIRQVVLI